ncbi:hypothetical protein CEXT_60161 [Caerostris extrusa]|uniref:Uncharacterized protein n=1 Tax=Caerostris extrusa TaxID=172846 RepID=A0AAV4P6P8_CAEEX|nr:hypothetical protein CEXT_60161 [Caerostris extrusa]
MFTIQLSSSWTICGRQNRMRKAKFGRSQRLHRQFTFLRRPGKRLMAGKLEIPAFREWFHERCETEDETSFRFRSNKAGQRPVPADSVRCFSSECQFLYRPTVGPGGAAPLTYRQLRCQIRSPHLKEKCSSYLKACIPRPSNA